MNSKKLLPIMLFLCPIAPAFGIAEPEQPVNEAVAVQPALQHSPLVLAIENGDLGAIQAICFENPACVNELDADGDSPLHWAAGSDHVNSFAILQYLIEHTDAHQSINLKGTAGYTPLHLAYMHGTEEARGYLIQHGADQQALDDKSNTPEDLFLYEPGNPWD